MSNAQSWTLIGGFLAILVAMVGLVLAAVRAEIGILRGELTGLRGELVARLDALDRDVQRLYERFFREA